MISSPDHVHDADHDVEDCDGDRPYNGGQDDGQDDGGKIPKVSLI